MTKKRLYFYLEILLLVMLGLVPLLWFKGDFAIAGGDNFLVLSGKEELSRRLYLWADKLSTGSLVPRGLIFLFSAIYWRLTEAIGFSLEVAQKIIFCFLFSLSGFSMYWLASLILPKKSGRLFATLFYMFNFYSMTVVWQIHLFPQIFLYSFLPLILSLYIKVLKSKRKVVYFLSLLVLLLLISFIFTDPVFILIVWSVILSYLAYYIISNLTDREKIARAIGLTVLFGLFWIFTNMWWILPLGATYKEEFSEATSAMGGSNIDVLNSTSVHSSFLKLLGLGGYWAFNKSYQGRPYYEYAKTYSSLIFTLINFLIVLLVFATLFKKNKGTKGIFSYLAFLALVSIFIAKGSHWPFGQIIVWLMGKIPLMGILRVPSTKFMMIPAMVYSILIGCSVGQLWRVSESPFGLAPFILKAISRLKNLNLIRREDGSLTNSLNLFFKIGLKVFIFLISVLMFGVYVFPFWTGEVIRVKDRQKLPIFYYQINDWLKKDQNLFRLFRIPLDIRAYRWGNGDGTQLFYEKPIVTLAQESKTINFINNQVEGGKNQNIAKILGLLNVKYFVLNNDLDQDYNSWLKPISYYYQLLDSQKNLQTKKTIGDVDFYEIDKSFFLPRFYIPQNIIFSNGDIETLPDIVNSENYNLRSAIYFNNINKLTDLKINELKERTNEIFIKGERKDIGYLILDIGEKENLKNGVPFPYVRQRPESLIWKLARIQEQFEEWKARKEPEKLIDKKLFYASKRIAELGKWGEEKDIGYWILDIYQKKMEEATDLVKNKISDEQKNGDILKLRAYWERHKEKINRLFINELTDSRLAEWNKVFEELEGKIAELEPKQDFSKLVYNFEIPKKGKYEIYVRNNNDIRNWILDTGGTKTDTGNSILDIGNKTDTGYWIFDTGNKIERAGEWVKLGERYFEEGEQELILPFSGISENLVDENLRIKEYSPNSTYRISFDYKAPKGGSFFIAEGKTGETAETQLSPTGDEFRNFERFFKSSSDAQEAAVHLSISVSEEKNLRIERIYQPEVMLRLKNTDIGNLILDTGGTMPKITFTKINPTKYKMMVEGAREPYTLVFSESFHQGWKIYKKDIGNQILDIGEQKRYGEIVASYFEGEIKEGTHRNIFLDRNTFETWGKKPIAEDRHYLVNGYANSWYITPEDAGEEQDYELIIEFAPQRLFYKGLFISGITLAGCLIYLLYNSIIVRRNRQ